MTPDTLKSLCERATKGPWECLKLPYAVTIKIGECYVGAPYQPPHGRGECPQQLADGELIAKSRELIPALVKLWEAAQKASDVMVYDGYEQEMNELRQALSELEAL